MKLYNSSNGIVIEQHNQFFVTQEKDWDSFINRANLFEKISAELKNLQPDSRIKDRLKSTLLAPLKSQEVWAAGVTYLRSREARMEESKDAGGGDFYARVYDAQRPELFFKATAHRTVGPGAKIRIRKDSKWNVPEPELTLFVCAEGTIEGYTIGNDMSSRDIEGENPLYLPQAKSYDGSAALGPCILVKENSIDPSTQISIQINRDSKSVFDGQIQINRMKRKHEELVGFLFRETSFPFGAFLMTGTGIVPPDHFTLLPGDVVNISIEGIGTLSNIVTQ